MALNRYGTFKVRYQRTGGGTHKVATSTSGATNTTAFINTFYPRPVNTTQTPVPSGWTISGDKDLWQQGAIRRIKHIHMECWITSISQNDWNCQFSFVYNINKGGTVGLISMPSVDVGNLYGNPLHYVYDSDSSWYIQNFGDVATALTFKTKTTATDNAGSMYITYNQTNYPAFFEITFDTQVNKLDEEAPNTEGIYGTLSNYTSVLTNPLIFDGEQWQPTQPKYWNGEEWVDLRQNELV